MLDVLRIDESQAGPAPEPQNFTGRVRMQNLARQGGARKLELLAVHFDAGAHTRPHTHPSEQVLLFVRGNGFVQLERWLGEYDALFLRRNNAEPMVLLPWRTWRALLAQVRR